MENPTWWQRNWKWFVPTGCLTIALLAGGLVATIFFFATSMMQSSDAYANAMAAARSHPEVVAAIGTPIEPDGFTGGSINTSPTSGKADLSIPVAGPKGKATVYVVAEKRTGEWRMRELVVQLENGTRIDLLDDEDPAADEPDA
jgi:hypothetical protein